MKKILKKVISLLIVTCLMTGIANIPAYAKVTAISTIKTTDAVLTKTYYTPAQALKKAVKSSAKATAKPTATKKTATKKPAAKAVSLTSQIISKYTKQGLTTLKAFANKMGLKLQTVYNQFVKFGVTKAQLNKVRTTLLNAIKRGANFCVCSTLAVAKYLGISQSLAAVQQIAAEISLNPNELLEYKNSGQYIATTWSAQAKVLGKNGIKNSEEYYIKKEDLINLKEGTKILVNTDCYNKKGEIIDCHAITVERQKDGKYAVYDILINNGNKVVYNKTQFERLISGKSAKGNASGKIITKPEYFNSEDGYIKYKFTDKYGVYIVCNSSKVPSVDTRTLYNKTISLVNKLLKQKGVSSLAKTWLNKAKNLVNKILNSSKNDNKKEELLNKAYSLFQQVSEKGISVVSLITSSNSIFSSLQKLLKNNFTYKVYNKYGEDGLKVISEISKKFNLGQSTVYNVFVDNKVTKSQMDFLGNSILCALQKENPFTRVYVYDTVNNALREIKNLVNK